MKLGLYVLRVAALAAALAMLALTVGCGNGGAAESVEVTLTSKGATISPSQVGADAERVAVTIRNDTDGVVSPLLHVHGEENVGWAQVEVGEIDPGGTKTAEVELALAVDYELSWGSPLLHFHWDGGSVAASSASCLTTLPPLTDQPLTGAAFATADAQLLTTVELAEGGDVDEAEAVFMDHPHNLMHDIDAPLRGVNEALAIQLCNEVVVMERELGGGRDPSIVREQAEKIREHLAAAAAALGVEEP